MFSSLAVCSAAAASREPIAKISHSSPCCMAGITFCVPIFAVLRIPQRTRLMVNSSDLVVKIKEKFVMLEAASYRQWTEFRTRMTSEQTESPKTASAAQVLNIAAYKFVRLTNLVERRNQLRELSRELHLRGTIL